jgi:hypothetical protein
MYLRNDRIAGNGAYMRKGTTLRVVVAVGPKLVFDQMAVPVLIVLNDCDGGKAMHSNCLTPLKHLRFKVRILCFVHTTILICGELF